MSYILNFKKELISDLKKFNLHCLPCCLTYRDLLTYISSKQKLDRDTCRDKYGRYTGQQWLDLIDSKNKKRLPKAQAPINIKLLEDNTTSTNTITIKEQEALIF